MHNLVTEKSPLTAPYVSSASSFSKTIPQQRRDKRIRRVLLIGYGKTAQTLHRRVKQQRRFPYQIVAVYDTDDALTLDEDVERVLHPELIIDVITRHQISEVWIALPFNELSRWHQLQPQLCQTLIDLRWVPDADAMSILSHRNRDFLGLPMVDLNHPPNAGLRGLAKTLFDWTFSLAVLILLLPLFIVLAVAIKLTSAGPVFFRQPRLGLNGKKFDVIKFRSMKSHRENAGQLTQAIRDDPRVTSVGRFMRRTSLDELPQFLNVLQGDMSVVGPRPHALVHNDLYKDKLMMYMQRHRVKPGITGWAQINGCRGETDTQEKMARRVDLDLHYIRHWSFRMDLKIILWTALKGWTDNNAY